MKYSDNIEIFLDFLRQAKREYQIAIAEEKEKDAASQDLDHRLELENNSYHDIAKIGKKRMQVRRERRQAKDLQQEDGNSRQQYQRPQNKAEPFPDHDFLPLSFFSR